MIYFILEDIQVDQEPAIHMISHGIKMDTEANVDWIYHYANPRGYSLNYIRNELFGIKVNNQGVFLLAVQVMRVIHIPKLIHHIYLLIYGMGGYFKLIH